MSARGRVTRKGDSRSGYALKLDGGGGGDFLGLEELKHRIWYFHILKHYESPWV